MVRLSLTTPTPTTSRGSYPGPFGAPVKAVPSFMAPTSRNRALSSTTFSRGIIHRKIRASTAPLGGDVRAALVPGTGTEENALTSLPRVVPTASWSSRLRSRLPLLVAMIVSVSCMMALMPEFAMAATKTKAKTVITSAATSSNPVQTLLSFVLHLDKHLTSIVATHGTGPTYAILWGIVFCETGLVVTPFLPGDSLLFAAGAFAGMGQLALYPLVATFLSAAILGDAVNYAIGVCIWWVRGALSSGKGGGGMVFVSEYMLCMMV